MSSQGANLNPENCGNSLVNPTVLVSPRRSAAQPTKSVVATPP
jgi:hypothetical protein